MERKYIADDENLLKKWDFDKNSDLDIYSLTTGSHKMAFWKCSKGHSYQTMIKLQVNQNCPICSGKRVVAGINDLLTINPTLCEEWDYEKNELPPSYYTSHSGKNVYWKCKKCGHSWLAQINNRGKGTSCPNCIKSRQTSFPEQALVYYFRKKCNVINHYCIGQKYTLDLFLPEYNVALEYDGYAWHNNEKSKRRDKYKSSYCAKHTIRLIRIRESKVPTEIAINNDTITYFRDKEDIALNKVIKIAFNMVIDSTGIEINVNNDRNEIYSNYHHLLKEKSISVLNPHLLSEWDYEKNQPLSPNMISLNSNEEVYWKCNNNHSFLMSIDKRTNGRNCPYCSNRKLLKGYNDFETWCKQNNRIDLLLDWDYANNQLSPSDYFKGYKKDVSWKCNKCGFSWQAPILTRAHGWHNCKNCRGAASKL